MGGRRRSSTPTSSQSPQIGAAVLPYQILGSKSPGSHLSQSPQIGAAVLPERGNVELRLSDECRNPLKSGLLSYHTSKPFSALRVRGRNPLKSGLLSYRTAGLPQCQQTKKEVAIPSNRGCCPTGQPRLDELGPRPRVAIPSNRGCCPTP